MKFTGLLKIADFTKANFGGFVLKKGFLYGWDKDGNPIATSTCVKNGEIAIYTKKDDEWKKSWIPMEEAIALYPELKTVAN